MTHARAIRITLLSALTLACSETSLPPVTALTPAALTAASTPPASATVGSSAGALTVKVVDLNGEPLSGIVVTFTITRGSGVLSPVADTTDADGTASSTFRVGTVPGQNEVAALVVGVPRVTFTVASVAGAARSILIGVRSLRFQPTQDSVLIGATVRDTFGNALSNATTSWVTRDASLLGINQTPQGNLAVKVLQRPGSTWIVATNGTGIDSIPVAVTDGSTGAAPCLLGPAPTVLAIGATLSFDAGLACIKSTSAGAEYAVVAHLNTSANNVAQSVEVFGAGVTTPPATFPIVAQEEAPWRTSREARNQANLAFERRLRMTEAAEIGPRVAGARAWFRAPRASLVAPVDAPSHVLPASAVEGATVSLNVNAKDFCSKPSMHSARIAAVTGGAIVMADVDNPAGGFTDEEYRAFAVAMDTLVSPVDTGAFGAPTDIDGNNRVGIFFTRAVNDLTAPGSPDGIVLGFYYLRDLLPQRSAFGACPGSNVGEMFYVIVPDPVGTINGNVRDKAFVQRVAIATIAHEYQHLINASRRMYVNDAMRVDEEIWLNEGLSHVAEELVFYQAAGTTARQNIGGGQLGFGTQARFAFEDYMRANIARYREYQRAPETSSPFAGDDQLATRGATWSFLRYLVDRVRPSDGDFWRRLVNSRTSGVVNLDSALVGTGVTTLAAVRDWSMSVLVDDNPTAAAASHQQASWNFITAMPAVGGGLTFGLAPRLLSNGLSTSIGLIGGGSGYARFGVSQDQEALIRVVTLGGAPLPAGVRLTIVRIK